MSSLGETLQRARVEQGLDLEKVSLRLKINPKDLAAIEGDQRAGLPSAFFYRSFVHQYALALSLDVGLIDAKLDQILSAEAPLPLPGQDGNPIRKREPEVQVRSSRIQIHWWMAAAGIVILAGAGIYAWRAKSWPTNPLGASMGKLARTGQATAAPLAPAPAAKPVVELQPAALPTVPAAPAAPAPENVDRMTINLLAREQTWLSIYSDGRQVYSGVLQANETKAVEGKQFARMTIGNAGGLEVQFNGRPIGSLGARGQVRTVLFTRDNFQIVQTVKDGV